MRHGLVVARQAAQELSRLVPTLRQRAARESEAFEGQGGPEVQLELQEQEAAVSHWWPGASSIQFITLCYMDLHN